MFEDEIVSIEYLGEKDTIDINTSGNRLFYANDILTHNSAIEEQEHEMHHIAGGISKINTADNVMTIYTSDVLKQRGEYRLQFIKTRSSSGVGHKVTLSYNQNSLRILDPDDTQNVVHIGKESKSDIGESIRRKAKDTTNEDPESPSQQKSVKEETSATSSTTTPETISSKTASLKDLMNRFG